MTVPEQTRVLQPGDALTISAKGVECRVHVRVEEGAADIEVFSELETLRKRLELANIRLCNNGLDEA